MPKTEKMANNKQIEMSDQQYKVQIQIQISSYDKVLLSIEIISNTIWRVYCLAKRR